MRLFVFVDRLFPEFNDHSMDLRDELPFLLKDLPGFPAGVFDSREDLFIWAMEFVQEFRDLKLSVFQEDGSRLDLF